MWSNFLETDPAGMYWHTTANENQHMYNLKVNPDYYHRDYATQLED